MKIFFKKTLNHTQMIASEGEGFSADTFSIGMLKNAGIPSLLKFDLEYLDGNTNFIFNISSMQPFDKVYRSGSMNFDELNDFILSLKKLSSVLSEYLLDMNDILFRTNCIFMDIDRKNYFFCLCPGFSKTSSDAFALFCNQLLTFIDYSDSKTVNLAFSLNRLANSENFSFSELENLGPEIDVKAITEKILERSIAEDPLFKEEMPSIDEFAEEENYSEAETDTDPTSLTFRQKARIYFHDKDFSEVFNDFNTGTIIKKIKSCDKPISYDEMDDNPTVSLGSKEPGTIKFSDITDVSNDTMAVMEDIQYVNYSSESTANLGALYAKERHIIGTGLASGFSASIKSYPFTIGRKGDDLDFVVDLPEISRTHCRILKGDDESYYLEDLNSTNETILNGRRLSPYTKIPLTPGDSISIADYEFIFR